MMWLFHEKKIKTTTKFYKNIDKRVVEIRFNDSMLWLFLWISRYFYFHSWSFLLSWIVIHKNMWQNHIVSHLFERNVSMNDFKIFKCYEKIDYYENQRKIDWTRNFKKICEIIWRLNNKTEIIDKFAKKQFIQ